jgi:hypothetical protein
VPNIHSFYDGTETLDLGNNCVVVLSERDFRQASNQLLASRRMTESDTGRQITAAIDPMAYNVSLMNSSIVSWNLTDENNRDVKVNPGNIEGLPNEVFRIILDKVLELNKEVEPEVKAKADGDFRPDSEDGDRVPEDEGTESTTGV